MPFLGALQEQRANSAADEHWAVTAKVERSEKRDIILFGGEDHLK